MPVQDEPDTTDPENIQLPKEKKKGWQKYVKKITDIDIENELKSKQSREDPEWMDYRAAAAEDLLDS